MACVAEMLELARRLQPQQVTLVPERRQEITTEGGLDIISEPDRIRNAIDALTDAGIRVSLFIDPTRVAVEQSKKLGAPAIELHTGTYSHRPESEETIEALRDASRRAADLGLAVHAGHGLNVANVGPVAAIQEIEELNIGHSIVSRSVFVGLDRAVREIHEAMRAARSS
jgi:pyridoxine 5-phosphate synthase